MSPGAGAPQRRDTPPDPDLLKTFRTYQRTGSYRAAAEQLDMTVPQVKRRLRALYDALGIDSAIGGNRSLVASYLLRDRPY